MRGISLTRVIPETISLIKVPLLDFIKENAPSIIPAVICIMTYFRLKLVSMLMSVFDGLSMTYITFNKYIYFKGLYDLKKPRKYSNISRNMIKNVTTGISEQYLKENL